MYFGLWSTTGRHSAEVEQVAGPQCFNVGAERGRGSGQSYAEFLKAAFRAPRL